MKSKPLGSGQNILASHHNDRRDDARGGSFLLPHQQLGVLALGTTPSNNQVIPIVINGTTITIKAVTGSVSSPNDVKAPGTAIGFATNVLNFLRRPDLTNANQVAASSANQTLLSYVGWAWPGASTNIVPFSLNKNVNGLTGALSSFNITGITVTSATWTAQTMQLYIEDGTYYIGTTRVLFTGGSTPTFTAPVSNPRIDIVTADSSGTLTITQGSENASPTAPAYPVNKVVICEVYNVVGETGIYDAENQQASQGYIFNDVRQILTPIYIGAASQVASGLFILDPGSEAQGDILYYNGAGAWARLPAGTAGQLLGTNGAGANPSWGPVAFVKGQETFSAIGANNGTARSTGVTLTIPTGGILLVMLEGFIALNITDSQTHTITLSIYDGTSNFLSMSYTLQVGEAGGVAHPGDLTGYFTPSSTGSMTFKAQITDSSSGTHIAQWTGTVSYLIIK